MCIGIPARITEITPGLMPMAALDVAGEARSACLAYLPEAREGDWVYVQQGFATVLLSEADAAESLDALAELHARTASGNPNPSPSPTTLEEEPCA